MMLTPIEESERVHQVVFHSPALFIQHDIKDFKAKKTWTHLLNDSHRLKIKSAILAEGFASMQNDNKAFKKNWRLPDYYYNQMED